MDAQNDSCMFLNVVFAHLHVFWHFLKFFYFCSLLSYFVQTFFFFFNLGLPVCVYVHMHVCVDVCLFVCVHVVQEVHLWT